ncbi:hypothetical protein BKA69DRAFT_4833 [Paraphysoderma sedebokerense]|nr:hypothetical protein BKA69DRAFT_4833 [Paraphysoderma sedebokerense]
MPTVTISQQYYNELLQQIESLRQTQESQNRLIQSLEKQTFQLSTRLSYLESGSTNCDVSNGVATIDPLLLDVSTAKVTSPSTVERLHVYAAEAGLSGMDGLLTVSPLENVTTSLRYGDSVGNLVPASHRYASSSILPNPGIANQRVGSTSPSTSSRAINERPAKSVENANIKGSTTDILQHCTSCRSPNILRLTNKLRPRISPQKIQSNLVVNVPPPRHSKLSSSKRIARDASPSTSPSSDSESQEIISCSPKRPSVNVHSNSPSPTSSQSVFSSRRSTEHMDSTSGRKRRQASLRANDKISILVQAASIRPTDGAKFFSFIQEKEQELKSNIKETTESEVEQDDQSEVEKGNERKVRVISKIRPTIRAKTSRGRAQIGHRGAQFRTDTSRLNVIEDTNVHRDGGEHGPRKRRAKTVVL